MGSGGFNKWTFLKVLELGFTIACLICKRVTDDEASRLFLYLQKLSREWSLLNNVTWDQIGAAVADATYGGYIIITAALLIGRLVGELPTQKRITEMVLLGIGAVLFIVLGSLEFAALDSVPQDLVDNAAIIGSLSLVTGLLFIIDMGGPKAKKTSSESQTVPRSIATKPLEPRPISQQIYDIEQALERSERRHLESFGKPAKQSRHNGIKAPQNGFQKSKDPQKTRRFDIYGKDAEESEIDDVDFIPPKMDTHSPVWSKVRQGQYGKYDIVAPTFFYPDPKTEEQPPSSPGEPGYVQYTAQRWGQPIQKAPRQSPTAV